MKTFENNKIFINSDEYIYRAEHLTLEGSCSLDHGPRNVKIKKISRNKLDVKNTHGSNEKVKKISSFKKFTDYKYGIISSFEWYKQYKVHKIQ